VPEGRDTRPPLGALLVIAVGLLATLGAALLSTDKPLGAVEVAWAEKTPLPNSKPAAVAGGGEVRLTDAGIRATEANISEYRLYRVAAVLTIDPGAAVGQGQVRCVERVPRRTIVAHTLRQRASYPQPSEENDLVKQDVPERIQVEFNSHSTDLAVVELGDAFESFVDQRGVTASWADFRVGRQEWIWGLPDGRPAKPLRLGFASVWRTTATPAARIACTLTTGAGSATVRTAGSLPR
jgi:hypothetical protein